MLPVPFLRPTVEYTITTIARADKVEVSSARAYAYVTDGTSGLRIIDLNPGSE